MDGILASGQLGRALSVVTSCFSEILQEIDIPFEKQKLCCPVLHPHLATGGLPTERSSPCLVRGCLDVAPTGGWGASLRRRPSGLASGPPFCGAPSVVPRPAAPPSLG